MMTLEQAMATLDDPKVAKKLLSPFVASDYQVCRKIRRLVDKTESTYGFNPETARICNCPVSRYLSKLVGQLVVVTTGYAYVYKNMINSSVVILPTHVKAILNRADELLRIKKEKKFSSVVVS